jgi:hypothetical protein
MVTHIIKALTTLNIHKEDIQAGSKHYILKIPDSEYYPFSLTMLNMKEVYMHELTNDKMRDYITQIIAKIYEHSMAIYTNVTSPNVDKEEFYGLIRNLAESAKKEVSGVDDAIDVLLDTNVLIEGNFSEYYRIYKVNKDPSTMIVSMVENVMSSSNRAVTPKVRGQLIKVINHYRKKVNSIDRSQLEKIGLKSELIDDFHGSVDLVGSIANDLKDKLGGKDEVDDEQKEQ